MDKASKFGRVGAAIAAAALASTMMAGVAFAADAPSVEGETSIATTNETATTAQGQTGIYLQIVDDSVISLNVPTKIYLAADQAAGPQDFKVPTNAKIENLGKAVRVTGWDVAATNGMARVHTDAEGMVGEAGYKAEVPGFYNVGADEKETLVSGLANDSFWLQATVDQLNYDDIAVTGEPAMADAWKMAKGGSTTGVTTLDLGLKGQINSPSSGKYANAPLIDTVTWKVAAQV